MAKNVCHKRGCYKFRSKHLQKVISEQIKHGKPFSASYKYFLLLWTMINKDVLQEINILSLSNNLQNSVLFLIYR